MTELNRTQIRTIEEAMAFPRGFGYVLDFSDRTMSEFFEYEFGIDIYAEQYSVNGSSKRNYFTTFLTQSDTNTALRVLRALWERREGLMAASMDNASTKKARAVTDRFRKIIETMEIERDRVPSEGVDNFSADRTLEELVADIDRTLEAKKPEVAIDHLHTYCVKKVTHLLTVREISCSDDEPLHSRFGKYRNALLSERDLHEFTDRSLKSSISLFESFNDLRNNRSLAHDNEILNPAEARFVFSVVNAILVLMRTLESDRYGS